MRRDALGRVLLAAGERERIPRVGQGVVLRHALAVLVHGAETRLRHSQPLLRGEREPARRLDWILRHSVALQVGEGEVVL